MSNASVKRGSTVSLGRVEGELKVGNNAKIETSDGKLVVVSQGAYFEGSAEVNCSFECETLKVGYKGWQPLRIEGNLTVHKKLEIGESDGISDNGEEVYRFLRQQGIKYLIVMGVHTNMCVLNRTFAIRQMTRRGIQCILARDLTDTMYNPKMRPFVSHDKGTDLVVEHIEKYWCPSVLSSDLIAGLP